MTFDLNYNYYSLKQCYRRNLISFGQCLDNDSLLCVEVSLLQRQSRRRCLCAHGQITDQIFVLVDLEQLFCLAEGSEGADLI